MCNVFGKEVTLTWRKNQKHVEQAFVAYQKVGLNHSRNRTQFYSDLDGSQHRDFDYTFALYLLQSRVIMACYRDFSG